MNIKHILKDHAYQNIPLSFDEAYELGQYALDGCHGDSYAQLQSIVALSALHTRATYEWTWDNFDENRHGHRLPRNAAEQIAGVSAAIFKDDIEKSEFGYLEPAVPYAMDNCGMGGDLVVTANVSTIAALIASAAGIPMCKHGSPSNADSGRHGSSDFISMLGIGTYASKEVVQRCVEVESFGYTEALDTRYKQIHAQTHAVAKLPHMNDIIGPITNPLMPKLLSKRILGVNHLVSPRLVAEAYIILNDRDITNMEHGIFVRGYTENYRREGMDELSICYGGTQVAELFNGEIRDYDLFASDFGILPVSPETISPPEGMSKGEFSLGILMGDITGPALQMVIANAALLFYLANKSQDLTECYDMAKTIHDSGIVYEKVLAIRKQLQ